MSTVFSLLAFVHQECLQVFEILSSQSFTLAKLWMVDPFQGETNGGRAWVGMQDPVQYLMEAVGLDIRSFSYLGHLLLLNNLPFSPPAPLSLSSPLSLIPYS